MSTITVEQYSEKAIVVRGNTIVYKDKLLAIGGKWNKMLKGGEGWIFPLTKKPIVEKMLSEPPTVYENENKNEKSQNFTKECSPKNYKTSQRNMTSDNSEVILTKKDYLHLISRIEYLEQQFARFIPNETNNLVTDVGSKTNKKNTPPLLSHINEADLCDNFDIDDNEDDENRETVQPLLRKNKHS
jgi:hypothetical protein